MKHLLHLVRADVRRFRILLALWVLVVIAETVFRAVHPTLADEPQLSMMFNLLATVLFTTRWLAMVLIVALVVQTHPLVGSDAFWMTRPISWRVLLTSKLVLLVTTLVAVPTVAELALMVASQVPIAEALPIVLQLILFQCLWLFIFMALSSVTRNLARLAVVAGRRGATYRNQPCRFGGHAAADDRGGIHVGDSAVPHPVGTQVRSHRGGRPLPGARRGLLLAFAGQARPRAGLGESRGGR